MKSRNLKPFVVAMMAGGAFAVAASALDLGEGLFYGLLGLIAVILLIWGLPRARKTPIEDRRMVHLYEPTVVADESDGGIAKPLVVPAGVVCRGDELRSRRPPFNRTARRTGRKKLIVFKRSKVALEITGHRFDPMPNQRA